MKLTQRSSFVYNTNNAWLVQLVEPRTLNPLVAGSSPASVLFFMFMAYQVGQQKVYKHLADTAIEQQNLDAFALIMDEWTKFVR